MYLHLNCAFTKFLPAISHDISALPLLTLLPVCVIWVSLLLCSAMTRMLRALWKVLDVCQYIKTRLGVITSFNTKHCRHFTFSAVCHDSRQPAVRSVATLLLRLNLVSINQLCQRPTTFSNSRSDVRKTKPHWVTPSANTLTQQHENRKASRQSRRRSQTRLQKIYL